MILGVGIDIVEVNRLKSWVVYSKQKQLRVLSESELEECIKRYDLKSSSVFSQQVLEFFASRFAAKEAFYKALSAALVTLGITHKTFSFEFARQHVQVIKGTWDLPVLDIDWNAFEKKIGTKLPDLHAHLSLSHEKGYAVSCVILSGDIKTIIDDCGQ